MRVIPLEIPDVKLIELDCFRDERGFFVERFNAEKFKGHNMPSDFLQDNHSRSAPGVLRGLHFQAGQGKLVGACSGCVWDVAVDIRPKSPTFGRHVAVTLDSEKPHLLWVPEGFAHGFCVIGDKPADVVYKVTSLYNPKAESGIIWSDTEFAIAWPIKTPTVSSRDEKLQTFSDFCRKN